MYSSTIKSSKQINLLFENEHYSIDRFFSKNNKINHRISYEVKVPLLYIKGLFFGKTESYTLWL